MPTRRPYREPSVRHSRQCRQQAPTAPPIAAAMPIPVAVGPSPRPCSRARHGNLVAHHGGKLIVGNIQLVDESRIHGAAAGHTPRVEFIRGDDVGLPAPVGCIGLKYRSHRDQARGNATPSLQDSDSASSLHALRRSSPDRPCPLAGFTSAAETSIVCWRSTPTAPPAAGRICRLAASSQH